MMWYQSKTAIIGDDRRSVQEDVLALPASGVLENSINSQYF